MQQGSLPVSRGGTRAFILDSASKEFEETRKTVTSNSCLQSNSTNISPRVITFSSFPFFPPFCIIPLASTVTDNKRKLRENLKRFDQIFGGIAMRDKEEERRWASAKYFQSPSWTRKVGRCRGILPPPPPGYLLTTYESFPDQWNNKVPPNFPTILSFFPPTWNLSSRKREEKRRRKEEMAWLDDERGRRGIVSRGREGKNGSEIKRSRGVEEEVAFVLANAFYFHRAAYVPRSKIKRTRYFFLLSPFFFSSCFARVAFLFWLALFSPLPSVASQHFYAREGEKSRGWLFQDRVKCMMYSLN